MAEMELLGGRDWNERLWSRHGVSLNQEREKRRFGEVFLSLFGRLRAVRSRVFMAVNARKRQDLESAKGTLLK